MPMCRYMLSELKKNRTTHKIMNMRTSMKIIALVFSMSTAANAQHAGETGCKMPSLNPRRPLADIQGNHIGIRVPDYDAAIKLWTEKLDFRIIHEWPYADEKLAYLAPAN